MKRFHVHGAVTDLPANIQMEMQAIGQQHVEPQG